MQENRAGRIRTWLIFAVITALAVVVYEFSLDYLPFENGEIILSGNKYLSKEEMLQFIEVSEGKSIEKVNTQEWEVRLKQNSRIRSVSVNRRSRSKILIAVQERVPKYTVFSNGVLYELDEEWSIVSENDCRNKDILVLSGDFKPSGGSFKEDVVLRDFAKSVYKVLDIYPELKTRVSEFSKSEDGSIYLYLDTPKHLKIAIGTSLGSVQIRKMYSALAYFETNKLTVNNLDLRGDDAVFQ